MPVKQIFNYHQSWILQETQKKFDLARLECYPRFLQKTQMHAHIRAYQNNLKHYMSFVLRLPEIQRKQAVRAFQRNETNPTIIGFTHPHIHESIFRGLCYAYTVFLFRKLCDYYFSDKNHHIQIRNLYIEYSKKTPPYVDHTLLNPMILFYRFFQLNPVAIDHEYTLGSLYETEPESWKNIFPALYYKALRNINTQTRQNSDGSTKYEVWWVGGCIPTITVDMDTKIVSKILTSESISNLRQLESEHLSSFNYAECINHLPLSMMDYVNDLYTHFLTPDKNYFEAQIIETQHLLSTCLRADRIKAHSMLENFLRSSCFTMDDRVSWLKTLQDPQIIGSLIPYHNIIQKYASHIKIQGVGVRQFVLNNVADRDKYDLKTYASDYTLTEEKNAIFIQVLLKKQNYHHAIAWWVERHTVHYIGDYIRTEKSNFTSYIFDSNYGLFQIKKNTLSTSIRNTIGDFYDDLFDYCFDKYGRNVNPMNPMHVSFFAISILK